MTNFYLFETRPTFKQSSALCKKQFFTKCGALLECWSRFK